MTKIKTHISNFPNLPFTLLLLLLNSLAISSDDDSVMSDLKKSLNPKSLWTEPNFCDWKYISCDTQGRVTVIQLKDLGLVGTLPPNLNNLTALTDFELQGNNIQGPLPTFNGLSQLTLLLLTGNNFSSIPSDFFTGLTSLTSVNMDKIPFTPWTIPESLKDATSLQNLSMNSANIMGKIPDFINGDTFLNLLELHLSFNMLEGGLPHGFSTLTVQSLWLNGQKRDTTKFTLVGTIEVLQNMTSLKEVWLHSNGLFGPLPDFSGLKDLSTLSLRDNRFTGPVPQSLVNLPSLRVVNLTNNLLQGPVPKFASNSVQVDMAGVNSFCNTPATASKGCDPRVNTLLTVAGSFRYPTVFGEQWKGNDPCAQDWPGISCDDNGNVTVIIFANKNLNGTISPAFAEFKALKTLNLANNNISGSIPKELVEIPTIKLIDLSNNQLTGDIPKYDNTTMTLNTTGNPAIGTHPPPPGTTPGGSIVPPDSPPGEITGNTASHKKASVGVIVGCVIVGAVLLAVLIWLGLHMYKKKKRFARVQSPNAMVVHPRHSGSDPDMVKITVTGSSMNVGAASETYSHTSSGPGDVQLVEAGNMVISIQVLRNVTNNFSEENVLGRGGFGTVYKGELHDGTKIAVKRMESGIMSGKGLTEFKSEIAVLTKVRHRHLVALLGYCLDGNERLLVYEYMPQGTLSHHLFNWRDQNLKPLEWTRRLAIALDVARGVEYLHGLAHQSFIHRDLKPSNILLGDDMRAKVADFGLVRLAPDGKASIETRLAGTFGYLAPEYAVTGRVTTKVDVYSFGVILMELITGRKALDERENEESMHLVSWFRRMHINKDTFHKAIDPVIELTEETLASISTVAELAGHCSAREPYQRPDMGHAVNVLSSLVELWKPMETDTEDMYGIDLDMTLPQALKKWQAFEGSSRMDGDTSSFLASVDNTQTSIPTRPSGFADSFTSADGR